MVAAICLSAWCCRGMSVRLLGSHKFIIDIFSGAFQNPLCCPCYLCACCGGLGVFKSFVRPPDIDPSPRQRVWSALAVGCVPRVLTKCDRRRWTTMSCPQSIDHAPFRTFLERSRTFFRASALGLFLVSLPLSAVLLHPCLCNPRTSSCVHNRKLFHIVSWLCVARHLYIG